FDGFLKVYLQSSDEENEDSIHGLLPKVSVDDEINYQKITATQRFSRPPSRYTEASLVKKLEELGIGRPSTYAPTITTIQKRGYVEKEQKEGLERKYTQIVLSEDKTVGSKILSEITGAEKNKLSPTDIGKVVTDFLSDNFKNIMDYGFTASVEKNFDQIAQGYKKWSDMIDEFYNPFHQSVDSTLNHSARATGERILGIDPKSGKQVMARISRFGPVVQMGKTEDEEKPKFANLRKGQTIETISLEDALDLFKLPRQIGEFEDKEMKVSIGRFGPYILHDGKFYSLPTAYDPYTIEAKNAIEVIKEKRQKDAEKIIKSFSEDSELLVQNGRWGAYISLGKKNYKIPKDKDPQLLDYETCMALIEEQKNAPKKGRRKTTK
ncbi:MAG: topoisomerase C-terminal repeat-containing protein, partial [Bacteroidota bacterium]|nr:topoisomerase C-terminal repeat-containing protein [Bacteroidota bacterium]